MFLLPSVLVIILLLSGNAGNMAHFIRENLLFNYYHGRKHGEVAGSSISGTRSSKHRGLSFSVLKAQHLVKHFLPPRLTHPNDPSSL